MSEETWRVIDGYPDYAVSDLGRVKRLTSRTCAKAGAILKAPRRSRHTRASGGYAVVSLCRDGVVKSHMVHRLVAVAFLPREVGKPEVNHLNGNAGDNRAVNLEWTTSSANQLHAYRLGLQDASGEKNGQAKLSEEQVLEIRRRANGTRGEFTALSKEYGVSPATISDVVNGRTWTHLRKAA